MKTLQVKANAVLEPELRELVGDLDLPERVKTAEKFQRWALQLAESAQVMEPKATPNVMVPATPKGFYLLNLGAQERARLQAVAKHYYVQMGTVIRWGIISTLIEHEAEMKLIRNLGVNL